MEPDTRDFQLTVFFTNLLTQLEVVNISANFVKILSRPNEILRGLGGNRFMEKHLKVNILCQTPFH
jgi:hypothetical protein